ncbi:T9SS type A sorting domain-containing protein [Cytophagaceae bacterium DM2B3-1]|uniref:T9SS type A sorting domain-containing protein n=1 Tax=Xanthocytophaga flava TaxID=3048013 RepID=A0ABT7CNR3_9BACT|nr:T9SS type A sorting domain-containing protein [Xanthocytophaga flavus]MDJ1495394.1 T9SS type A sorting domain-containing protein [Xanthocytophaga flavus]
MTNKLLLLFLSLYLGCFSVSSQAYYCEAPNFPAMPPEGVMLEVPPVPCGSAADITVYYYADAMNPIYGSGFSPAPIGPASWVLPSGWQFIQKTRTDRVKYDFGVGGKIDLDRHTVILRPSAYSSGTISVKNAFYCQDAKKWIYSKNTVTKAVVRSQPTLTVSGPSSICSSGQFSITNLPTGFTIESWKSSNVNGLTINNSGIGTRMNNFNGNVVVSATVASPCGGSITTQSFTVSVGSSIGGTYSYGGGTYNINLPGNGISVSNSAPSIYIYLDKPAYPSSSYTWVTTYQTGNSSFSANGSYAYMTLSGGASRSLACTITTPCGSNTVTFSCYNYSSGGFRIAADEGNLNEKSFLSIYPIPTNQYLQIDNMDSESSHFIKLNNFLGQTVYEERVEGQTHIIDTGKLPNGIYILDVVNTEGVIERKKVIVQK